jgi:hypothetical protein
VDTALRSKIAWFERAVADRDRQLTELRASPPRAVPASNQRVRQLEADLAALRRSTSYRIGRAVTAPVRGVRRQLARARRRRSGRRT